MRTPMLSRFPIVVFNSSKGRKWSARALLFPLAFACHVAGGPAVSSTWARWVEAAQKNAALPFPDFSWAGYGCGERPIPPASGKIFKVTDYGAIPDDDKSDKAAIQKAIDAAAANGGGTVFFPKGRYLAHLDGDPNESIRIAASGIVLKGEGAGPGGSVIHYDAAMQPVNPTSPLQSGPSLFRWQLADGAPRDAQITVLAADTRPGSREVELKDASALRPGDRIYIDLKSKEAIPDFLAPYELEAGWTEMGQGGVLIKERHEIEAVRGNTVRLRECAWLPLKAAWNVAVRQNTVMTNCGVEDLHFTGNWKEAFKHHRSWMDDGGFACINMERVADSWVRRCRFTDFNAPLSIVQGLHCTVLQVALEGNGGHGGCGIYNSSACLAALVEESAPHWHGPGVAKGALANVFWRIRWTEETSIEMHASAPWGNLWDACEGGLIYARDGGDRRNLPNHLGKLILWNHEQVGLPIKDYSFWRDDSQWGRQVRPLIVGWHGSPSTFKEQTCEVLESLGEPVTPGSLWEAQLARRLGQIPAWLGEAKAEWPRLLSAWGVPEGAKIAGAELPPSFPLQDGSSAKPGAATATPSSKADLAPSTSKPSPAARWSFEEDGGAVKDSVGTCHGKRVNATQAPGVKGKCAEFPGDSQASVELAPLAGFEHAVSILFWIKASPADRYQNVLMKAQGNSRELGLFIRGSLKWSATYAGGDGKPGSEDTGLVLTDGKWHHVAVVFDGGRKTLTVWVDGVEKKKIATLGDRLVSGNAPLRLGQGLSGCLDEVALYRGVLGAEQIRNEAAMP